jgi:tellurite methyltransferase
VIVLRRIIGFRQDDQGDWIADLSCLHSQHVRHQPPFHDRGWVLTESGRAARVGTELACPLCDRAELPDRLRILRSIGPFDEETLPAGLRGDHRLADGIWGRLSVIRGTVGFRMASDDPLEIRLAAGDEQAIPPLLVHRVVPEGAMEIVIELLVRDDDSPS